MKRLLTRLLIAVTAVLAAVPAEAQLLAFPGAEGFGRYTTGGRGGTIYHVTNLNDSGTGSLRDAVSGTGRIIVFDVSGTIYLKSALVFKGNNTVLGQTAPGEGIQVYGNRVSFSGATNLIVRYMRFRMGKDGDSGKDACGIANGTDMIFDHCSVLWGQDENFSVSWDNKGDKPARITIQNSIIGQGLQSHSCGGLIQTDGGVTLYRNLYIENKTRNPKVKGLNQYVNNVVYNWGNGGCYIMGETEGATWAHIEGNYFMKGQWNSAVAPFIRALESFHVYSANNYYDDDKDGTLNGHLMTEAEQAGTFTESNGRVHTCTQHASLAELNATVIHEQIHGDDANGCIDYDNVLSERQAEIPAEIPAIANIMAAPDAYMWMIDNVGPTLPARDDVDQYLIDEIKSFGTVGTKNGITTEKTLPHKGTGTISGGMKPLDSDNDGMPDAWETANGLNPNDASDAMAIAANGYCNLENYVNTINAAYPYIKKPLKLAVASVGKTEIALTWDANGNTDCGFIIETSTDAGKTYAEAARAEAGATAATLTGLTPETAYSVRLRAFSADGLYSDYADAVATETTGDPAAPYASTNPFPANGAREGIAGGLTLTWDNATKPYAGTVTYAVYLGEDAANMAQIASGLTAKSLKAPELTAGKTYSWRVDATNELGTTQGEVWTFTTTAAGVLFYTDFHSQPAEWAAKWGNNDANTNIINAANTSVTYNGMTIGSGAESLRIIAMPGCYSDDTTKDYGPATADDAGATAHCVQFYTTKAGGYIKTPEVTGPCTITVWVGNPNTSQQTVKLLTVNNGEEKEAADLVLGAKKRMYKFSYTYTGSGTVAFKLDANAKKVDFNDILIERYIPAEGETPIELTSGSLVNDNMSYADGTLTLGFNQNIKYNGGATVKGANRWENITVAASGKNLNISYEGLDVNTSYQVVLPEGAITDETGKQSYSATVTMNTCDFPALKADGETHYGKAAAELPLNFAPFNTVAPFATVGALVQEKQNDYPHWVQASGGIAEDKADITSTSDKLMCYFTGPSMSLYLDMELLAAGNVKVKVQESRNCDIAPGWRTVRVLTNQDFPFTGHINLHPESNFVKVLATTLGGNTLSVKSFRLANAVGDYGEGLFNGVATVLAPAATVAVSGNTLSVNGAQPGAQVAVYDIAGRLVAAVKAADGSADLTLAGGLYIVRIGAQSYKVKI